MKNEIITKGNKGRVKLMLKSIVNLIDDVIDIATASIEIGIDVTQALVEIAKDMAKGTKDDGSDKTHQ